MPVSPLKQERSNPLRQNSLQGGNVLPKRTSSSSPSPSPGGAQAIHFNANSGTAPKPLGPGAKQTPPPPRRIVDLTNGKHSSASPPTNLAVPPAVPPINFTPITQSRPTGGTLATDMNKVDRDAVVHSSDSAGEVAADFVSSMDWLEVPTLFYFFAYLIELQELHEEVRKRDELNARRSEMPFSPPSDNGELDRKVTEVEREISFSARETNGVLLNRLFVSWSQKSLRKLVKKVVNEWEKKPNSPDFEAASFQLLDAITDERKGKVHFTLLYRLRGFIGAYNHFYPVFAFYLITTLIGILCVVFLGVFGRDHLVACIVLCAVLGVDLILIFIVSLLLLHHNTYSEHAAVFFRPKALYFATENMRGDSGANSTLAPTETYPGTGLFPSAPIPGASGPNQLANDRANSVLLAGVAYAQHEHVVEEYQEKQLQDRIGSNDPTNTIDALTDKICVTALIYCLDDRIMTNITGTLWESNFALLRSSLSALDVAYRRGSERFKVFLLHAPDVWRNEADRDMVMSWVKQESRPVLFFALNASDFNSQIPLTSRLEVPLTVQDTRMLVLRGMGIDEEMNRTSISSSRPLKVPAYTLGRRIGGGAFGNVFEAVIDETGAKCAVKRMYLKADDDDMQNDDMVPSSQLLEIAQEVEIMSSLSHPNIVQYMFCERDGRCISIFMELCTGGSLASMITTGSLDNPTNIKRVLLDIVGAVMYLHGKRIVHRDLKPDNVLFRDGRAKVTDFGTAVHKSREDLSVFKGTVAYMAPEIIVGEPYGKACDVWSIGCIAAEVLGIDLPQRSLGLVEMGEFYNNMGPNGELALECDMPEISAFLLTCLQRNPSRRYTARELYLHPVLQPDNNAIEKWVTTHIARWKKKQENASRRNSYDLDSGSEGSPQSDTLDSSHF